MENLRKGSKGRSGGGRRLAIAAGAVSAAVLAACSTGVDTVSHYEKTAAFSSYKTFAWARPEPYVPSADSDTRANASLRERIQSAIYNDLTQKGVAFVENEDEADLQVTYTVGRRDQLDLDYYPNMVATPYYGIGYSTHIRGYYAGYDPSYWSQEVSARMYTEGTLTIDMFDRRAQKSVWTGMGSRPIDDKDRVNPGPVVDQVVKEILSDYPPAD